MNIGYTGSENVKPKKTRKTISFFGKRITTERHNKTLQPIALGAANLAAELQAQKLTIIYMAATTHSIEVDAPLRAVYYQWTQFEEFLLFMEGVAEVRQEGEKRLFWRADIGGKLKEWEAERARRKNRKRFRNPLGTGASGLGTLSHLHGGKRRGDRWLERRDKKRREWRVPAVFGVATSPFELGLERIG
jgi:hypothetical protein